MILLSQCVAIAVQTVLHQNGIEAETAKRIEYNVLNKAKEFQRITSQAIPSVDVQDFEMSDILTKTEFHMLHAFAIAKGYEVRELVRNCITFYTPIEMMVQQLADQEGEKI